MRIGLFISNVGRFSLDAMVEKFTAAEQLGLDTAWAGHTFDWDALTLLALAGRSTHRIELGSWVVPALPRHPTALASQALTVQSACSGRLLLGIGVSHEAVIERRMGIDYSRPLGSMREMMDVLPSLLAGRETIYDGQHYRMSVQLDALGSPPPPVILAALGPRMLELAGRVADGVAIWLGGARFLTDFALERIDAGANRADRPRPRIIAGLPVAVTTHPSALAAAEAFLAPSSRLPAYRAVLEREGLATPGAAALIGDEASVRARIEELAAIGVSDFNAIPFDIRSDPEAADRTRELLSELATQRF